MNFYYFGALYAGMGLNMPYDNNDYIWVHVKLCLAQLTGVTKIPAQMYKELGDIDACFYADAILTGAGTMAREAACMGVPSVSFFAGSRLLAVDQSLVDAGKMYFSRDVASIMRYLDGAKSGEASMTQSLATQEEIFGKLDEFIFGE